MSDNRKIFLKKGLVPGTAVLFIGGHRDILSSSDIEYLGDMLDAYREEMGINKKRKEAAIDQFLVVE